MEIDPIKSARAHLGQMMLNYRLAVQKREDAERALKLATQQAKMASDEVSKARLKVLRLVEEAKK